MKIWLDTTPLMPPTPNESDCIRPTVHKRVSMPSDNLTLIAGVAVCSPSVVQLRQASPLHVQLCAQDRWLVCHPTGVGQIVVLDGQAKSLLDQFRLPISVEEVIPLFTASSIASIKEAIAVLRNAGLLVEAASQRTRLQAEDSTSLTAWLHLTNACNLRCSYCYLDKNTERMSDDIALRAIDAVFRSAAKRGFTQINLKYAGGEASLHMSSVIAVHDYAFTVAQRHGIMLQASILSNGVVLSQKAIADLSARHISVMISLDGLGSYHDRQRSFISGQASFVYVDRTITKLLASGIVPHISITVSQQNLEGISDLLLYIIQREMPFTLSYYRDNACVTADNDLQFSEQQMIDAMRSAFAVIEAHLPERCLLRSLIDKADLNYAHQRTCDVGHNYLVIDQHGGVAKCQAVIKQTVTTIDSVDPLLHVRNDRQGVQGLSVDQKEGCRTCDWRYWCAGGCPALTYQATGRYDIKSPNCHIYQALFPEVLRLEALRLLKYKTPLIL